MPIYLLRAQQWRFRDKGLSLWPDHRHQIIFDVYGLTLTASSSYYCAGQRLTPHYRTLDVRPGRITKKLELKYDYDCEKDDTR